MGDLFRFPLVSHPGKEDAARPLSRAALRAQLEEAAQIALDAADRIIAALDHIDGDPDREDGGDDEPDLGAPEEHGGSQVTWLRGTGRDLEVDLSPPS